MRQNTAEEGVNLGLGQNGFHVLVNPGVLIASDNDIDYWMAVKVLDEGSFGVLVVNESLEEGSPETFIFVESGHVYYGKFRRVGMTSGGKSIAYIGKKEASNGT